MKGVPPRGVFTAMLDHPPEWGKADAEEANLAVCHKVALITSRFDYEHYRRVVAWRWYLWPLLEASRQRARRAS